MPDYIVTPDKREIPSSHLLSEELHRRALSVEMQIKGSNYKWQSIHFYDPAVPETQCFVECNDLSHVYKVTLPFDSTPESQEMQSALVEIFLHEVGGKAFDVEEKKSYSLKEFQNKIKNVSSDAASEETDSSSASSGFSLSTQDSAWLIFSWAIAVTGFFLYFQADADRKLWMALVAGLSLLSAIGMTYSLIRRK